MAENDVRLEFKKLQNLINFIRNDMPAVKVGILGESAKRTQGGINNAEIGFVNEFGKMTGHPKIPARSFLRMPLSMHFMDKVKEKKSLSSKEFEKAITNGKADDFARKVGLVAEEVIQEAFSTNGYGNWKPNAPYTVEKKGSSSPLIDTGQLRRSITSRIDKK